MRRMLGIALTLAVAAALALPPAAQAQKKEYVVGVSLASDINPFYIGMRRGMDAKAKELGVKVRYVVANEDMAAQLNGVQDLIIAKVDAILISPIDATAAMPAYDAATRAGIPIISIARVTDKPNEVIRVKMPEKEIGVKIGEWLARKLNGKGNVALIKGPGGASMVRELEAGLKEVFSRHPGIKIVAERNTPLTREEGLKNAEDILTTFPDLQAIYCTNDEQALGAAQAVVAAKRKDKIVVTGLNGVPPALQAVKDGRMDLTVQLNPPRWGALGIQVAYDLLQGKKFERNVPTTYDLVDATNIDQHLPRR